MNLLNLRPFTSAQAISKTAGIGVVSLRRIRNAATLSRPLEELIAAANALPGGNTGAELARHFDWYRRMMDAAYSYGQGSVECFGIDPEDLPQGATVRPYLADAAEVRADFDYALSVATRYQPLPSAVVAAGLANLDARIAGRTFKDCYISYADDPWSGNSLAFFVDTETGFGVLTDTYWAE